MDVEDAMGYQDSSSDDNDDRGGGKYTPACYTDLSCNTR